MTLVKFCGMTREADVVAAAECGVDALGFVLWPGSPRRVNAGRVAGLIRQLPARVTPVGVFVRPSDADLLRAIDAGIRVAQLHGLSGVVSGRRDCEVWVASRLAGAGIEPDVAEDLTVLLDAHDAERHGGTGRTIDWARASHVARTRRVMLAGGLTAANVAEAIWTVHPYGVDVASGIEDGPGIKNAQAMQDFVSAVRQADQ